MVVWSINKKSQLEGDHRIDAALFDFNCSLSRGAILCDEVGLGKTI
jgi:hypothetical protein